MSNRQSKGMCGGHRPFLASYRGAHVQTSSGLDYWPSSREGSGSTKADVGWRVRVRVRLWEEVELLACTEQHSCCVWIPNRAETFLEARPERFQGREGRSSYSAQIRRKCPTRVFIWVSLMLQTVTPKALPNEWAYAF